MRILVTGGAGFIGSAVVHHLIDHTEHHVINLDKLTYAGNPQGFAGLIRFVTDRPATTSATP